VIRIALADDHPVVRKGLSQFFGEEEGLEVVGEFDSGEALLEAIPTMKADVVVLDLRMPGLNGIEVIRRLARSDRPVDAILLAGNISEEEVIDAMRAGAKGILLKELAPNLLVQAVRKVAAGGMWLEKDSVSRAMERLLRGQQALENARRILTPRELELVGMVATGLNNRQIAETLCISEGTVKTHLHSVFEKLEVKSRTQLIAYARDHGLL
jgi:DNA-binding NarL/FixJ family response regulator